MSVLNKSSSVESISIAKSGELKYSKIDKDCSKMPRQLCWISLDTDFLDSAVGLRLLRADSLDFEVGFRRLHTGLLDFGEGTRIIRTDIIGSDERSRRLRTDLPGIGTSNADVDSRESSIKQDYIEQGGLERCGIKQTNIGQSSIEQVVSNNAASTEVIPR
jgi:hypothetical protein